MSKVNFDNIPFELQELKIWACWTNDPKGDGTISKAPINPLTGYGASSTKPETWCDFETVERFYPQYGGIGIMIGNGIIGIDIDNAYDDLNSYLKDDSINNVVSECIETMGSYAEVSPSGNGVHILAYGDLPETACRKGRVEMYQRERFLTVTGNVIGRFSTLIEDEEKKSHYLHKKYLKPSVARYNAVKREEELGCNIEETKVIKIACDNSKDPMFKMFLNGGWEEMYRTLNAVIDESQVDFRFMSELAKWTNGDRKMIYDICEKSSLKRDKWYEMRGDITVLEYSINNAVIKQSEFFRPPVIADLDKVSVEDNVVSYSPIYYAHDDTGNAERLRDAFGDIMRYSYQKKKWIVYDGKLWSVDMLGAVKKLAEKTIERMSDEDLLIIREEEEDKIRSKHLRHISKTRSSSAKTNMIKETEHLVSILPEAFDSDINLFNANNGYIDLENGQFYEHDREKYFTKISNVDFVQDATCPQWEKFLYEIFEGNLELIGYIKRAIGYSLSGSTKEQVAFFAYGNGRNGKSVFLDVVNELMGTYATNIQPQTIMVKQTSGGASSDIARLAGSRFVTTVEPNEGVRLDEGLVKQLTGGDKVTARFLHENEFDFVTEFKLWMATNHKPFIRGTDDGIWRRLAVIPFKLQIPKEKIDYELTNKLKNEISGILNWALDGYEEWSRVGLREPTIIDEQRNEYRLEMDPIELFIEEHCERQDGQKTNTKEMFAEYDYWAKKNNQYEMSNAKFGREMSKKFEKLKSNSNRYYIGIRISEKQLSQNDSKFFNKGRL